METSADEAFILDLQDDSPYVLHVDRDLRPINHQYLTESLARGPDGGNSSIRPSGWADVDADGILEWGFSYYLPDSVRIEFYDCVERDHGPVESMTFPQGEDRRGLGYWGGEYWVVGRIDANDDGRDELLVHVNTNLNYQPRALFTYDLRTDSILWRHEFGAAIGEIQIADFLGDRTDEILMGSYAWSNGSGEFINGTNDDYSYAIMLDRRGNLIWRKQLGGVFSWCSVLGIPQQAERPSQVIATVTPSTSEWVDDEGTNHAATGRIVELDASTAELIFEIELGTSPSAWQTTNTQHVLGGGRGFVTSSKDGRLRLYDLNSSLLAESELLIQPTVTQVTDVDQDGSDEVIVITGDNRVLILSRFLEPVFTYHATGGNITDAGFLRSGSLEASRLLVSTSGGSGSGTILSFNIPPSRGTGLRSLDRRIREHRALLLLMILAGPALVLVARQRVGAALRSARARAGEGSSGGQLALSREGHLIWSNVQARAILGLRRIGGWKRLATVIGAPGGRRFWGELVARKEIHPGVPSLIAFHGRDGRKLISVAKLSSVSVLGSLYELFSVKDELAEDSSSVVVDWFDLSSRIAHRMKSPLSHALRSIELAKMSACDSEEANPRAIARELEDAEESIRASVKMTDRFLRFRLEKVDIGRLNLHELLEEAIDYAVFPLEIGVKVSFSVDAPAVQFSTDRVLFKELIALLLQNAAEAVDSETGEIRVTARLARDVLNSHGHDGAIIIRIQDNGSGIDDADLVKVFEPFWTTKRKSGGTGLGLAIARRICDLLSAAIEIESTKDEGTVVSLRFETRPGKEPRGG